MYRIRNLSRSTERATYVPITLRFTDQLNGWPVLDVELERASFRVLDIVRLERYTTAWTTVGTYVLNNTRQDENSPTASVTSFVAVHSLALVASKTLVSPTAESAITFSGTVGATLSALLDSAKARGILSPVAWGWTFNGTTASDGGAWGVDWPVELEPDSKVQGFLETLASSGMVEFGATGDNIRVNRPGNGSVTVRRVPPTRLRKRYSISDAATRAIVEADDKFESVSNPPIGDLGVLESMQRTPGVSGDIARQASAEAFAAATLPSVSVTAEMELDALGWMPGTDVLLGQYVWTEGEMYRLRGYTLSWDPSGAWVVSLTLGSETDSLAERLARRAAWLGANTVGNGRISPPTGNVGPAGGARIGILAPELAGTNDARSLTGGFVTFRAGFNTAFPSSGPYSVQRDYSPLAGDIVQSLSVNDLGSTILGRVVYPYTGETVPYPERPFIDLAEWQPETFGSPGVISRGDWRFFDGALMLPNTEVIAGTGILRMDRDDLPMTAQGYYAENGPTVPLPEMVAIMETSLPDGTEWRMSYRFVGLGIESRISSPDVGLYLYETLPELTTPGAERRLYLSPEAWTNRTPEFVLGSYTDLVGTRSTRIYGGAIDGWAWVQYYQKFYPNSPTPSTYANIPLPYTPRGFLTTGTLLAAHSTHGYYGRTSGLIPTSAEQMTFGGLPLSAIDGLNPALGVKLEVRASTGIQQVGEQRSYQNAFWRLEDSPEWTPVQPNAIAGVSGEAAIAVTESGVACLRLALKDVRHGEICAILAPGQFPSTVRVFRVPAPGSDNPVVTVSPDGFIRAYRDGFPLPTPFDLSNAGGFFYPLEA